MRALRFESPCHTSPSMHLAILMAVALTCLPNSCFAAAGGTDAVAASTPLPAPAAAPPLAAAAAPASTTATADAAASGAVNKTAADNAAADKVAADKPAADKALADKAAAAGPDYGVVCQYVLNATYFEKLAAVRAQRKELVAAQLKASDAKASPPKIEEPAQDTADPTDCANVTTDEDARVLSGPGDLMVVVPLSGYEDALKRSRDNNPLRLFLNGFDLGTDGLIASAERGSKGVALRFHVPNKTASQAFWTTVYNEHGMIEKVPLEASVGWAGNPAFIRGAKWAGVELMVSVTNARALVAAGILASLLVWFFFWALFGSDTFRVAPTYPWWNDARSLQTKLHRATVPFWQWPFKLRKSVAVNIANPKIEALLKGYFPKFEPAEKKDYETAALEAINGSVPADDATKQVVVGLALTSDWGKFRLPFSLAKVQWGAWMMFATTAAVFLWLIYARLPALEGSVLGLVAVSTLTAGASLIIDNNSSKKNTNYSQGFFYDIMTDSDGVQQAHRYQAIVVNVMLFAIGVLYVWQHLAYPTFDQSWLELLGISGLAQVAGKGTIENKNPNKTN